MTTNSKLTPDFLVARWSDSIVQNDEGSEARTALSPTT